MRNRITKRFAIMAILCALIMALAAPALAASYSKVYGQTQDRIRVRASASASGTVIDNIVKNACVYITDSKTSSGDTYLRVNYRNSDGDISNGWVRMQSGNETYVKILSAEQAQKSFSVKGGNLPSKRVGTFAASARNAAPVTSSTKSSSVNSETIKSVQTMLKALKYYSGEITGNVGSKTEAAIKKFQKEFDLTVDGVAGPKTIAKLESVYNGKGGSSASSSSSSSGSGLKLGSNGTDVRNLQQDLTTLGYYWADITGNFGSKTQAAVKTFQEKNNLTADGVAGTKTLNAIASAISRKGGSSGSSYDNSTTLRLGSNNSAVTQLQTDLKQLGYYYADITGNFGAKTEAAVRDFQKDKRLTADGIAGAKTLQAISDAIRGAGGSVTSSTTGLKLGSTGNKVTALQQDLTALGYYYGDISGHYGSLTQAAVKKFQKAKGITQDGIAGTSTLNAIAKALGGSSSTGSSTSSSSLREGDEGSAVLELQTMLKELGYYYGDLTGRFGSLTKQAVRKFQDDQDLTVDGIAGNKTLNLLRSMTGNSTGDSVSTGSISSYSVAEKDSYFEINQDGVRLRSTYSLSSAAKTTMNKGKAVQATRKYVVAGTTWYYITVKNSTGTYQGYVRAKVLDSITKAEYESSGDAVTNVGSAEILGMIRVTANSVAIREAADSDSAKMGTANKGDVFYYMKKSGNWYQLQSGYWIKNTYADELDEDEIDDYLDDYSGGTYREGDSGSMVLWIQEALDKLDYYDGDKSGHYGSKTKEAVRKFQKDHGLSADGVAGPKTIARLMEEVSKDYAEGSGNATYNPVIYNINWFDHKSTIITGTGTYKITDIATGRTMSIKIQSAGNHADVEPLTKADTEVLCSLYGVANASQLETMNKWQRRAVVMTNGKGDQFVGSIYAIPHGQDTVSGNSFDGQFCLHFLGSTIHAGDGGSVSESDNHQAKIKKGVEALNAMKDSDGNKITSVSTTYP